jgi:protein canopy 3/4
LEFKKKKIREVRFIEVMETVCDNILKYNVHAERSGSLRYSKGESQTMSTLKGLKNRGVKVELGIPDEHWDTPSAEITQLKKYVKF